MKKIRILGISAFFHDSAVALLENGEIKYASQEERFSRIKHDQRFPKRALDDLLKYSKIRLSDIDYVVFFEKPFLKFERLIETYLAFAPRGLKQFLFSMPLWLKEKATLPLSPKLPPFLLKTARTSAAVRFLLSVIASTIIPTPP